ncbi:hypothetical protein GALL_424430 [mine drainage metagenome]|uniref:Uncharacterized protein n=1 Tax=mine drainage metagenome TaxID=410659 RepID=A0A1J5PWL9_9ZZZZ
MHVGEPGQQRRGEYAAAAKVIARQVGDEQHHADQRREQQRRARAERVPAQSQFTAPWRGARAPRPPGDERADQQRARDQRRRQRGQQHRRDDRHQHREFADGGRARRQRGRRAGVEQLGRLVRAASHRGHRRSARNDAAERSGEQQPARGAEQTQCDMAGALDRHHQHGERPQHMRIQTTEPAQRVVGKQRQHDQRRRGQQQQVVQLVDAERVVHEAVQPRLDRQQPGDQHRERRAEFGRTHRQRAEQQRDEQRKLTGDARVLGARAPVPGDDQRADAQRRRGQHGLAEQLRGGAGQRRQREAAHARLGVVGRLIALALEPDQQPGAERGAPAAELLEGEGHRGAPGGIEVVPA